MIAPVVALGAEFNIEVVQSLRNDKAHLMICHTAPVVSLLVENKAYQKENDNMETRKLTFYRDNLWNQRKMAVDTVSHRRQTPHRPTIFVEETPAAA